MSGISVRDDGFGRAMYDFYCGCPAWEMIERDDGFTSLGGGPATYFAPYQEWPAHQRKGIRLAKGKVLDIGCGAGRVALHLQAQGLDVLGIDTSPFALKVCKLRGLNKARLLSIMEVSPRLGVFDTFVMYGNNFGLFGSLSRARRLLKRFHKMASDDALIIAETRDPYSTGAPYHRAYHRLNRRRGRMGGQLRIRVRYLCYTTPWLDYLLASKEEIKRIVSGTGWRVRRFIDGPSGMYVVVIAKES